VYTMPSFLCRPSIVLTYKCPVDTCRQEKTPTFVGGLCSRYLSSRVGQVLFCRNDSPVDCHRQKKTPTFQSRLGVRVTYFPR